MEANNNVHFRADGNMQYYDAPEVVPAKPESGSGLEVVTVELSKQTAAGYSTLQIEPAAPAGLEYVNPHSTTAYNLIGSADGHGNAANGNFPGPVRAWWRRKRYWLTGVVFLIIVGIILGAVLGTRLKRKDDSTQSSDRRSVCSRTNVLCPQVLAVPPNYDGPLVVFARGTDNNIWYRSTLDSDEQDWVVMRGAEFVSQPTSIVWDDGQIQVFGVSSGNNDTIDVVKGNVLTNQVRTNETWSASQKWKSLGQTAAAPVAACAAPRDVWVADYKNSTIPDRLDTFIVDDEGAIFHNYWEPDRDRWRFPDDPGMSSWDGPVTDSHVSASGLALGCRNNPHMHDIVSITDGIGYHWAYNNNTRKWIGWDTINDTLRFTGDPVLVTFEDDQDRFDVFAVENSTRTLWRMEASSGVQDTVYSPTYAVYNQSLNSAPSIITSSTGRLDVVALGTDDKIYHVALDSGESTVGWELVGDFTGDSAPVVATFKCQDGTDCTGILVLGRETESQANATLLFTHWKTTADSSWKTHATEWVSLGGNLTTDFMIMS